MFTDIQLDTIVLPEELKHRNSKKRIIAFEGVDACGKSTICEELGKRYDNYSFVKIPKDYVTMPFKEYLSFGASYIGNSLIYMASLADRKEIAEKQSDTIENVVMDRSLWSTIAINYAKHPEKVHDIINIFASISQYIPLPDVVYVLDVPYEVCRERIRERAKEVQRFDAMPIEEYNRHMEFYYWLEKQNVGVRIYKQNFTLGIDESVAQIYKELLED